MAEKKWHIWERCKETWVGKAAERLRGKTMGFIAETEGDKTTSGLTMITITEEKYSETCVNGHLYSETTCIKSDVPKESA